MAKYETTLTGDLYEIRHKIKDGIINGSVSASIEDCSDFETDGVKCSVMVFERYSYMGGNRVSMNVTLFGKDGEVHVSAITSGGSQAVFFKVNTFGEEAFLEKLIEILE